VLAFHNLGSAVPAMVALDESSLAICTDAWRDLCALDEAVRTRTLAAWRAEAASALPAGLARLHPSWIEDALAGEGAGMVAAIRAQMSEPLRALCPKGREMAPGSLQVSDDGTMPEETRREIARLALGWLEPLVESAAGPMAEGLGKLEFEELLAEVTRTGARTVGHSLAGASPALRARAMASVGEPWAGVIGKASFQPISPSERSAAAVFATAAADSEALTPADRMLAIGLAALRAELVAEHPGSPFRVAGRLPARLGRTLVGW